YNIIFFNRCADLCRKKAKRIPRPEGWAGVPKKGGEEHMKNMKIAFDWGFATLGCCLACN
ncbi:hypothetical protein, partial [Subdoligranulum variabile]|uniref:hypothetical protein n=1 Tax=Subdoligranulum variabile TaxID=214851 RepID=UPI0026EB74D3